MCLLFIDCPPEGACVSNYVLSLSFGSRERRDTVMDRIATVMDGWAAGATSLNVPKILKFLFLSLSLQSCNTCNYPICIFTPVQHLSNIQTVCTYATKAECG